MTHQKSKLTIDDIGKRLGLTPQFLFEAAKTAETQYELFDLPKKSGGARTICTPKGELKRVQRAILEELLQQFEMPEFVHGCVKGRSIVTNAKPHVDKPLVLKIDIKDFFGSIKPARVLEIYKDILLDERYEPLTEEREKPTTLKLKFKTLELIDELNK